MKRFASAIFLLSALAAAVFLAFDGPDTQASPDGVITTMAIDMDPNDGGGTPVNDEDTVGNIDPCWQIPNANGETVTFDVVTPAIPLTVRDGNFAGIQYDMMFNAAFTVTARDHTTAGVVLVHRNPGGWVPFDLSQELMPLPWSPPVSIRFADLHAAGLEGNGETPANAAGGVLGRYTLTYDGSLANDRYVITMSGVGYGGAVGPIFDDPTTVGVDDDADGGVDEDILLDGNAGYAMIAVGVDCPLPADAYIKSQEVRAGDCSGSAPTTMPVNTDTDVCLRKVLRQDDVSTLDVSVTPSPTAPGDCSVTPDPGNPSSATLPQNTDVTIDELYTINCSAPSAHSFTFGNTIAITTADLYDNQPSNNSVSTPMSIEVTAEVDLEVTAVSVDAPDTGPAGLPFDVTVNADVTNNGPDGPVNADVTIDLDLGSAPDCTRNPDSSQTVQDLSLGSASPGAVWSVTCATAGTKTFNGSASVAPDACPHVTDPDPGNNSGSTPPGSDSTDVGLSTDVEAVSWSFPDDLASIAGNQVIVVPSVAEVIQSTQVIINNGGIYTDPVATDDDRSVADTAECDVEPNADSDSRDLAVGVSQEVVDNWTVTWTEMTRPPYSCDLMFETALTITELDVSDYDENNNTDSVTVVLVRDSDGDTVVDNYQGIVDNCPDHYNPDQTNTDVIVNPPGDALGDVCDPDDDNDGYEDDQEDALGSDPLNPDSTPEHTSLPGTCTDGVDNDLDGWTDDWDLGCDYDGDGIPNVLDACFAIPEDMDGYEDADGCPDADNDMDGICDPWVTPSEPACTGSDGCPNVAEDYDAFEDTDGCPDPDNDQDGFPDYTDMCPGTDWTAGPDGIADSGDEPLDDLGVPIQTKEDYDGVVDWDGCHDSPEDDWDGDGVTDEVEVFVAGTDPADMDTDNDGLCDGYKPPLCASEDANNNGIVDPGETDPTNADTDGDGLSDGLEKGLAFPETPDTDIFSPNWQPDADPLSTTDPLSEDSDADGIPDGVEDSNQNGKADAGETDAAAGDTDHDGYGDATDNCPVKANPGQEDFELDGIGDHCDDSDLDVFTDYVELLLGTDPLDDCPDNPTHDAWPLDMDNDQDADIFDVMTYVGVVGVVPPVYVQRLDLDVDGDTDIFDVMKYVGIVAVPGKDTCTNP